MRPRTTLLAPVAGLLLLVAGPAGATPGDLGHDIGKFQCVSGGPATSTPTTGTFGLVGVNNGSAWTLNPCLSAQATWAAGLAQPAALYANTANPAPSSGFYWPASQTHDPAWCANSATTTDPGCAYDYGWHTAGDALAEAATQSAVDPYSVTWWLDVETTNTWNGDGISNAADLQGMADRLRHDGVPEVGVYGLATDWATITGSSLASSYTRGSSNAYRANRPFTALYPLEDGPVWFGGVGTAADAKARCGNASLTGGERLLSQYKDAPYDADYRCADPDRTAPTAAMTAPTALISTGSTTGLAWTGSDAGSGVGSGVGSYDLRVMSAGGGSPFGPWTTTSTRVLGKSASVASPPRGVTRCWGARSRDVAGNVSAWSGSRCVVTPLDDRDLTASSGWTRTTGASAWFMGSYSSISRLGATLTRSGLQTSRLVLLAYRCPTCGSVEVLLGSTHLTTVSLAASSSYRVLVSMPRFSLRTTSVTLKVVTSGKLVRVDALATSRA